MIVCRNCGHSNPDGTAWCQKPGCGVFLAGGDPSTAPVPAVPDATPIGPPPIGPPPHTTTNTEAAVPVVGPVPAAVPAADSSVPASDIPPIRPGDVGTLGPQPADATPQPGDVPTVEERAAGRAGRGGGRGLLVALAVLAVVAVVVVVGGYVYLTGRHDKPTAGSSASPTPTVVVTPVPAAVVSIGKVSSFATYNGVPRPPQALLDGKPSTFWSASYRDKKPSVRFAFGRSQTVVRIDIVNGAAGKGFIDRPSAKDITVRFPDGRAQTVQLKDELGTVQSVAIDAPHAGKWVEILVNSVYDRPHRANNMYLRTSMADVAFFSVANPSPSPTS